MPMSIPRPSENSCNKENATTLYNHRTAQIYWNDINQMNKFSPRIAQISQPLRELLSTKKGMDLDSLKELKEVSSSHILTLYEAPIKVSADASSYSPGTVILQCHGELWKPIEFASQTLTETEGCPCCTSTLNKTERLASPFVDYKA